MQEQPNPYLQKVEELGMMDEPPTPPEEKEEREVETHSGEEKGEALRKKKRSARAIASVVEEMPEFKALSGPCTEEIFKTPTGVQFFRSIYNTFEQFQHARIQTGNRFGAVDRMADKTNMYFEQLNWLEDMFLSVEQSVLLKFLHEMLKVHPMWPYMDAHRGLGPSLGAALLAYLDINRARTPSAFQAVAGFSQVEAFVDEDGKVMAPLKGIVFSTDEKGVTAEVLKKEGVKYIETGRKAWEVYNAKGKKEVHGYHVNVKVTDWPDAVDVTKVTNRHFSGFLSNFNTALKTKVFLLVSEQFCKYNKKYSAYYPYYEQQKEVYLARFEAAGEKKPSAHAHYCAIRKTCQLFLSHMWTTWREVEGLPLRDPYVLEKYGDVHKTYISPQEFGWPKPPPPKKKKKSTKK